MNAKQKYYLTAFCLVLVRFASGNPLQETLVDKIIANVNDRVILQSDLEAAHQQHLLLGAEELPDLKCEILKDLIISKAVLSEAKQEGVVVKKEAKEAIEVEISDKMRYLLEQVGSEAELVRYLGRSISDIKREMREQLNDRMTLEVMKSQLTKDVCATPKEVKEFFEALPFQKRPYYPAEVSVRQIVQYPQVSQQEQNALLARLDALKVRIQNGEDFGVLAREYSQDSGSALLGGDLGFCRLGALNPAYEAAALALQPGEVSDPVVTPFGFHLIQLIVREKDRYNSRHILLRPSTEMLDIEAVKTRLARLRATILAGELTFEQAARKFSEVPSAVLHGGLLTREADGARVSMNALPPDVYFVVEQLSPGAVSEPVLFTAADGREAVRILLLEEKIAPHQANLAQDYAKIKQLLIDQKTITTLNDWLARIIASASIRVAPEYQHCKPLG